MGIECELTPLHCNFNLSIHFLTIFWLLDVVILNLFSANVTEFYTFNYKLLLFIAFC